MERQLVKKTGVQRMKCRTGAGMDSRQVAGWQSVLQQMQTEEVTADRTEDWQRWSKPSCSSAFFCKLTDGGCVGHPVKASWIEKCLISRVRSARHRIQNGSDLKTLSRSFKTCWEAGFLLGGISLRKNWEKMPCFLLKRCPLNRPNSPLASQQEQYKLSPNYELLWNELTWTSERLSPSFAMFCQGWHSKCSAWGKKEGVAPLWAENGW